MSQLHVVLSDLVALVLRQGGYMSPEDQDVLWRARQALWEAAALVDRRDVDQESV